MLGFVGVVVVLETCPGNIEDSLSKFKPQLKNSIRKFSVPKNLRHFTLSSLKEHLEQEHSVPLFRKEAMDICSHQTPVTCDMSYATTLNAGSEPTTT